MNKGRYRVVLMGASGVGKTSFLTSYFFLADRHKQGNFPVKIKKTSSAENMNNMINTLFSSSHVEKTTERIDLSFHVDSLDIGIDCFDVPGQMTRDISLWYSGRILDDLRKADALLFFLSAEDAMLYQDRLIEDNLVFTTAISHLKQNHKVLPVWFFFTKVDKFPNVSLDELNSRIPALLKVAGSEKNRCVCSWKVTALGCEPKYGAPLGNYAPENVLEPMEQLLETVRGPLSLPQERENRSLILFRKFFCR